MNSTEWLILAFGLGIILASCQAQSSEVILHGPSYHFERKGYNENNYGLGFRFDNNVTTGFYQNSEYHTSVYLGYHLRLYKGLGVLLGGVTGYEALPVIPAAVLVGSIPIVKGFNAHVSLIPIKSGLINLSFGVEY